jgi:2-amino-4-hydroxy-6-hydroxymethyldihydropteridine diphosphokinase
VRVFVALGSNLGDRSAALDLALRELARDRATRVLRRSTWIETEPVGGPDGQGMYLNGVVELETARSARALLALLLAIEARAGRTRGERCAPRTLDLDLLIYGDEEIDEPGLTVPHPRLEERAFVLEPLAQLAPELVLRRCRRTVRERLAELSAPAHLAR